MCSTSRKFTAQVIKRTTWVLRGVSFVAAIVILVTGIGASSGSANEQREGREPGLPFMECIGFPSVPCLDPTIVDDYGWLNLAQAGRAGSVRSKQWAPIPITMMASVAEFGFDDVTEREQTIDLRLRAFFTSPRGSANNYGDSAVMVVRTAAFGSLPVEIGVQFSQSRRPNGELVPLEFVDRTRKVDRQEYFIEENEFSGPARPLIASINVKVVSVAIDGVAVQTVPTCETGPRAKLRLAEKKWKVQVPTGGFVSTMLNPDVHFYGAYGGSLHGSVDIPAFSGCITSTGDDISPILTAAISGPDNPVAAKIGPTACVVASADGRMAPNPPGVNSPYDPRAGCFMEAGGGNFKTVPDPMPLPPEAP